MKQKNAIFVIFLFMGGPFPVYFPFHPKLRPKTSDGWIPGPWPSVSLWFYYNFGQENRQKEKGRKGNAAPIKYTIKNKWFYYFILCVFCCSAAVCFLFFFLFIILFLFLFLSLASSLTLAKEASGRERREGKENKKEKERKIINKIEKERNRKQTK